MSLASAPTTNPTMSVQMIDMATPPSSNLRTGVIEASLEPVGRFPDLFGIGQKIS
jgi:hypothetical protein